MQSGPTCGVATSQRVWRHSGTLPSPDLVWTCIDMGGKQTVTLIMFNFYLNIFKNESSIHTAKRRPCSMCWGIPLALNRRWGIWLWVHARPAWNRSRATCEDGQRTRGKGERYHDKLLTPPRLRYGCEATLALHTVLVNTSLPGVPSADKHGRHSVRTFHYGKIRRRGRTGDRL